MPDQYAPYKLRCQWTRTDGKQCNRPFRHEGLHWFTVAEFQAVVLPSRGIDYSRLSEGHYDPEDTDA